mgnify:CR=1 FL=1|jgi:hypothetical protein
MAKVKEMKDDAIVDVKINKAFYLMVKAVLFTLFTEIQKLENSEQVIKETGEKEYKDMTDIQRSFYTTTLLLAEIERQASVNNLYNETEIDTSTMTD